MIETTTIGHGPVSQRLVVRIDRWVQQRVCALAPQMDRDDTILECGCGDGRVLAALPGRFKAGVEARPGAARLAIGRGLDIRPTIDDFTGTQFSRIVFSAGIEAASNPAEQLANVRPFLAEDGLLLLSQPVGGDSLRQGSWRAQSEMPSQLARLLEDAGFTPRRVAFQRHTYRSAGFRFADANSAAPTSDPKTFWTVTPFLALVAVARPRR